MSSRRPPAGRPSSASSGRGRSAGSGGRGGPPPRSSSSSGAPRRKPKKKKKQRSPLRWVLWLLALALLVVGIGFSIFAVLVANTTVPTPNEMATNQATIVYYADGTNEIGRLGDTSRRSIPLNQVPLVVQRAILAAEDRSFFDHGGISPLGVARAVLNNLTGGSTQGGSTITQQYAKNAFLTQERSWDRKLKEALLAFKLETVVSKDQILGDYLNTIYFGRGAYGIDAAARAYFGQPVGELDASQAAVLAAIIKSPSGLAPEKDLEGLKARWSYVLDGMVQQGWLTNSQLARTAFPKIKKGDGVNRLGGQTGYILTTVQDSLHFLGFDEPQIQQGGLRVVTTIDLNAQRAATAAVHKVGPQSGTKGLRIGLAAVRPGTGEIVAMYGGEDFITDQINNATHPFAQAGSTFKPFALATALDQGVPLTSWWNGDSPSTVNGYTFNNYSNKSYGQVTLLQATEDSINSAYVAVEDQVGVSNVADTAIKAGIPADTPGMDLKNLNLTFVLGTASPSALDMAGAYATFAASGVKAKSHIIGQVTSSNGGVQYQAEVKPESMFPKDIADSVTYALSRVVTNGTGFAARALGRPAAGKTGTTDNNLSAWFVGYTPQLAAAVMMAKEDASGTPQSLSGTGGLKTVTGGSFPAAMWTAFMKGALSGQPKQKFPEPPPGVRLPKNCPTDPTTIVIPSGCPTPQFDEGLIPGIDGSLLPSGGDVAASQSPDASVVTPSPSIPVLTPTTATPSPSATGSTKKPKPPTQEARP